MIQWLKRKIADPLINLLKMGVEPQKLALAVTLAFLLAFFPVFGAHSLLCLLLIWMFRLNPAAVFLVNNLAYPLLFILYLPQIKMGEWLFNAPAFPFSVDDVVTLVSSSPWEAIKVLWDATMRAIAAWFVIAGICFFPLFFTFKVLFQRILTNTKKTPTNSVSGQT